MSRPAPDQLVSVVVPTRNSERTIVSCLRSVRDQTHQAIEIVVVDNGSGDGTPELSRPLADVVLAWGPERSAQRNAGAAAARGSYLLFVDSDMVLEPSVVAECLQVASADALVIPERSFGEGFWARCKKLERGCYVGDETIEAARFFTREVFESCGGYDEALTGYEDWDLHERLRASGARIRRIDAVIHHDEGRLRLGRLVAKKYYYGKDFSRYAEKHPALAKAQRRLVRPAFLRHRRRLLAEPALLAGLVLMKGCELAAGASGYAETRLLRGRT